MSHLGASQPYMGAVCRPHFCPVCKDAEPLWPQLLTFIAAGYTFKLTVALVDTAPFYLGAKHLGRYLRIHPVHGIGQD